MIREDRELLAELARLNTAMPSLAMRIMDSTASVAEQRNYARCLMPLESGCSDELTTEVERSSRVGL